MIHHRQPFVFFLCNQSELDWCLHHLVLTKSTLQQQNKKKANIESEFLCRDQSQMQTPYVADDMIEIEEGVVKVSNL